MLDSHRSGRGRRLREAAPLSRQSTVIHSKVLGASAKFVPDEGTGKKPSVLSLFNLSILGTQTRRHTGIHFRHWAVPF